MLDPLLESSHRDDSNEGSNIGLCEEITQVESIEVIVTLLIWTSGRYMARPTTANRVLDKRQIFYIISNLTPLQFIYV